MQGATERSARPVNILAIALWTTGRVKQTTLHVATTKEGNNMAQEIKSFKDVWQPPFKNDMNCYIVDDNGMMAFSCIIHNAKIVNRIVSLLNDEADAKPFLKAGTDKDKFYIAVSDSEDVEGIKQGIKPHLLVRGWGYLTSPGGLNLGSEQAYALQSQLVDYCVRKLKGIMTDENPE